MTRKEKEVLAAVFEGNGKLVLKDRPKPNIKSDTDALIKVTGVGICGTDLHILQTPPAHPARKDIILGHEFTGIIEDAGAGITGFKKGDHVIIDPHPGCGVCEKCRSGYPDRCISLYKKSGIPGQAGTIGIFSDGAMTSYAVVPQQSLYRISESVPSHIAALAEPLACVVNAARKLNARPGETVLILGAGPIGLLFVEYLKACGVAKIIVSEVSEYRRKMAMECGADVVVNPEEQNIYKFIEKETNEGPEIVVEAVGPLFAEAIKLVHSDGRVLQFGHDELAKPQIPIAEIVKKELTIYGAFIGKYTFTSLPEIIESGVLPLDKVVSHQLPLSRIHDGLDLLRKGKGLKIILHPEEY
jgi:threonine 3-dehydrogenase